MSIVEIKMHVTEIIHWIVEGIKVMGSVGGLLYAYKWLLQICGYTDLEAKGHLKTAKKCFGNGRFEKAVKLCDEVITKENGFLYRHRRFVPTEDRISFDTVAEAYVLKGDSCIKLSRYADAIQTYDKAIEKSCASPEIVRKAYFGKGEALMRLENWKEAREVYQKIIRQYAEDLEEAKYYFAYCCIKIKEAAESYCKKFKNQRLQGVNVPRHQIYTGKVDEMIFKGIQHEGSQPLLLCQKENIKVVLVVPIIDQQTEHCLKQTQNGEKITLNSDHSKECDKVEDIFKQLKQSENKVIGVLACFRLAENAKSSKDLYNECYKKISDVSSNDNRLVEVWVRLGDFFHDQLQRVINSRGNKDDICEYSGKAMNCYKKVIEVENTYDIDMQKYYVEAYCGIGDIFVLRGIREKFEEAIKAYDEAIKVAIKVNENNARAYYGKARVLKECARNSEAIKVYELIIEKFPDPQNDLEKEYVAKALIDLGDIYREDKTKSENYFSEVVKKFEKEETENLLAQVKTAYKKIIEGRCSKLSLKEDYKKAFTVYKEIFEEFKEKPLCEEILKTTKQEIVIEVDDVSKELIWDAERSLKQGSWEESLTDFKRCICLIRRSISFDKKFNMGGDSSHEWRKVRVLKSYLGIGLVLNARGSYEDAARICKVIWKIVSQENLHEYDYHLLYLQKSVLAKLKRWDDLIQMYDDMLGRYKSAQDQDQKFRFWCLCLYYKVSTFAECERDYIKEIDKMLDSFDSNNEGKFLLNEMICLYYKAGAFTKFGNWDVAYKFYEQILSGDEKFYRLIKKWAEEEKRIIDSSKENDQVIVEKVIEERVRVAKAYFKQSKNFKDFIVCFITRFGILSIKEPNLSKLVVEALYREVDPSSFNNASSLTNPLLYFALLENFTDEFEKIKDSFEQVNNDSTNIFLNGQLQKLEIYGYVEKRPEIYHALNTFCNYTYPSNYTYPKYMNER
ncbi:MAG: tetratricopeptide repeat protein [Acetobacter sp.]|nr:tetratricopeptide repeat protein [Acetobacter sp.]